MDCGLSKVTLVSSGELKGTSTLIDMKHLKSGMYFVRIGDKVAYKIVKE